MGDGLSLRFLIDEDVPRSTARILREAGFDAVDCRDVLQVGENLLHRLAIVEFDKVRLREK